MKRYIVFTGLIFLAFLSCKKETNIGKLPCSYSGFKYYQDEPYHLGELSGDYILIGSDTNNSDNAIREFIKSKDYFDKNYNYGISFPDNNRFKFIRLKLYKTCDCEEISWIINETEQNSVVDFAHYTIQTDDCTNMIFETIGELCVNSYSDGFLVQVRDTNDLSDFNNIIHLTNTRIIEQNRYRSDWYSLHADKNSTGDALQMANYFYETGFFKASEPNIFKMVVE
jgi:hypothetical protein